MGSLEMLARQTADSLFLYTACSNPYDQKTFHQALVCLSLQHQSFRPDGPASSPQRKLFPTFPIVPHNLWSCLSVCHDGSALFLATKARWQGDIVAPIWPSLSSVTKSHRFYFAFFCSLEIFPPRVLVCYNVASSCFTLKLFDLILVRTR